jgi:ABC-type thiamine transport system ATPase subunit
VQWPEPLAVLTQGVEGRKGAVAAGTKITAAHHTSPPLDKEKMLLFQDRNVFFKTLGCSIKFGLCPSMDLRARHREV